MSLRTEIFQKRASYVVGCNHGFDLGEASPVYNPVNRPIAKIGSTIRRKHKAHLFPKRFYIAADREYVSAKSANWGNDHQGRRALG